MKKEIKSFVQNISSNHFGNFGRRKFRSENDLPDKRPFVGMAKHDSNQSTSNFESLNSFNQLGRRKYRQRHNVSQGMNTSTGGIYHSLSKAHETIQSSDYPKK